MSQSQAMAGRFGELSGSSAHPWGRPGWLLRCPSWRQGLAETPFAPAFSLGQHKRVFAGWAEPRGAPRQQLLDPMCAQECLHHSGGLEAAHGGAGMALTPPPAFPSRCPHDEH